MSITLSGGCRPEAGPGSTSHAPGAVVCLTGVSAGRELQLDVGGLGRGIVLENDVVFGSVNANHRHYEQAAHTPPMADHDWLERLITRRVPLEGFAEALRPRDEDVKVVLEMA